MSDNDDYVACQNVNLKRAKSLDSVDNLPHNRLRYVNQWRRVMSKKQVSTQDLVVWVNQRRLPMAEVERLSGLTRQAVNKRLKAAGCFKPRKAKGGAPGVVVAVSCAYCGGEFTRRVKRVAQTRKQYCQAACYASAVSNPGFVQYRHGSRLARAVVAQHFRLLSAHVVHHKDGDQRNNDLANLAVFSDNASHVSYHRGGKVRPIWDGEAYRVLN